MTVFWREDARNDVARIAAYIAIDNPVAARQVARELFLAGESLAVFPKRGRPGRVRGTRELVVHRPYIIVYDVDLAGNVYVIRVWHGAQYRES